MFTRKVCIFVNGSFILVFTSGDSQAHNRFDIDFDISSVGIGYKYGDRYRFESRDNTNIGLLDRFVFY